MSYYLHPNNRQIEAIKVSSWSWSTTVELIRRSGILLVDSEIFEDSSYLEVPEPKAPLIADWIEQNILADVPTGSRVKLDGSLTSEPDDGTFHRDNLEENYSADTTWLVEFVNFLRKCEGFYSLG